MGNKNKSSETERISMIQERRHDMSEGGFCLCPKCGERIEHKQGIPCQEERCPECGTKMLREALTIMSCSGRNGPIRTSRIEVIE
jgi:hypothetical protein